MLDVLDRDRSGCEGWLMIATDAWLVARLHVDFGHVSSAVCMPA